MATALEGRMMRASARIIRRALCALIAKEAHFERSHTLRERLMLDLLQRRCAALGDTMPRSEDEQALIDAANALETEIRRQPLVAALEAAGVTPRESRLLQQELAHEQSEAWKKPYNKKQRPRWEQDAMTAVARGREWYANCGTEEIEAVLALLDRLIADVLTPLDEQFAALSPEQQALVAPILACKEPPARLEWWQLRGADGRPLQRNEMTEAQHASIRERDQRRQDERLRVGTSEIIIREEQPKPLPDEGARQRRAAGLHRYRGRRAHRASLHGFVPTKHRTYGRIGRGASDGSAARAEAGAYL